MSGEVLGALITAVFGGIALIITKLVKDGKLGEVWRSESVQEETAVSQMAKILEYKAKCDDELQKELLNALVKALNTIKEQSSAMQQVALSLQGHERDSSLRWSQEQHDLKSIMRSVEDLEKLVTDVALKFIRQGRDDESLA